MDPSKRNIIIENIDQLISHTNYEDLITKCVSHGLITEIMKSNIQAQCGSDVYNSHKRLFHKITTRGPDAFEQLILVLQELDCTKALRIICKIDKNTGLFKSINGLKQNSYIKHQHEISNSLPEKVISSSDHNAIKLKVYNEETELNAPFIVEHSKKIHFDPKFDRSMHYTMKTRKRGVAFIVNIIDFRDKDHRNGASIDRDNLIYLFRNFGFNVFYYENISLQEFNQLLDELLHSNYTKETECFIMALMTHGGMDEGKQRIEFHDGAVTEVKGILDKFSNSNCQNLMDKPKIFIFPFCRGNVSDRAIRYNSDNRSNIRQKQVETDCFAGESRPSYSDILICYASIPGFRTHRDPDKGSWYIQILCQVWAEHAHDTHIDDLQKLVGSKTQKITTPDDKLQTSNYITYGFHKKLYFNPGYYEDM